MSTKRLRGVVVTIRVKCSQAWARLRIRCLVRRYNRQASAYGCGRQLLHHIRPDLAMLYWQILNLSNQLKGGRQNHGKNLSSPTDS